MNTPESHVLKIHSLYDGIADCSCGRWSYTCAGQCTRAQIEDEFNKHAKPRPKHYIAGSGSHGCLYDNCEVYSSYKDAVNSLADTFELGRTRKTKLRKESYLELTANDGADYCEITECDCPDASVHSDSGELN